MACRGDGARGHPPLSPYDRIAVTSASSEVPEPLLDQLAGESRLILPLMVEGTQELTLYRTTDGGLEIETLGQVLYVEVRPAGTI